MNAPKPSFSVHVDVTNPGQFFACCGLLELAHRLWPGTEGWFEEEEGIFSVCTSDPSTTLQRLFDDLRKCEICGLSEKDRKERNDLEKEKRRLRRERKELSEEKEQRRKDLGTMARKGAIFLGSPFFLALDWWQTGDEDPATPKTWAGLQEIHRVARAAQDALSGIQSLEACLDHSCVLRPSMEYRKKKSDEKNKVEPFYFDARRFAHALDMGFSLDAQEAETEAHPVAELLCLIGLQRFMPARYSPGPGKADWEFAYSIWLQPLPVLTAAAVANTAVPTSFSRRYGFRRVFRDDQKRLKAFSFATPIIGGEP